VNSINLGAWITTQRQKRTRLTPEQISRLDALGFIWDPLSEQWEQGFAALVRFHKRQGHCRVTINHEEDGYRLGRWVSKQRDKQKSLTPKKVQQLEALGFIWDPHLVQWEESFSILKKLRDREGHCRIPNSAKVDGFWLGAWAARQRRAKDELTSDQIKRLNAIGFIWKP
jgi:hypothetical protein